MKKLLKKIWWIPVVLVLAAGGLVGYQYYTIQKARTAAANVQTVKLSKGTITTSVSGSGSVRASQNATLTWPLTGQVGKLLVKVGDEVQAGQVLASLDPGDMPASVVQAKSDLITDQQALEDLSLSKVDLATTQQAVTDAQSALIAARQKRAYLNSPTRGSAATIAADQANYEIAKNAYDAAKNHSDSVAGLSAEDSDHIQAALDLQTAQKKLNSALLTLNYDKGKPTAEEIAAADAAVGLAQAQVEDAQRKVVRLKNGASAGEIAAAENKIKGDQSVIDSMDLTAPFNGVVTSLAAYTGQAVSSGTTALRIDDKSGIYVDLSISEVDVNNVQAGQPVQVTFDAIPEQAYTGNVASVGLIGTSSSGTVNFSATVQISDADDQVKTGMTASAVITTSTQTDLLLAPSKSIKTVNSQKVVYVSQNGRVMPVTVKTGTSSDTMTQIVSGNVKEGDAIVANPTTATLSTAMQPGGFSIFALLGGGPGIGAGGPPAGGPPAGGGPGGEPPSGGGGGAPPSGASGPPGG